MSISLCDLAQMVEGRLCGDETIQITGAATIRDCRPGEITLADDPKLAQRLADCAASAVLVPAGFDPTGKAYITVGDVPVAFAKIVQHFRPPRRQTRIGISPAAHISPSAKIGPDVDIHPLASVGDDVEIGAGCTIHSGARIMTGCRLGENVTVFSNAVLYEDTIVGDRSIIHSGSVIGAYGFGYQTVDGRHRLSAQLGNVEIGPDVEVGACATIDRGTYGTTVVGEGTKIDNHVQIAHNCRIGKHNILCAHGGIAGSVTTGDYVVMAGQVGIKEHTNIGARARLGAKAGVIQDIPAGTAWVGIPATPEREQFIKLAALSKLPEMRKELKALQRAVEELTNCAACAPQQDAA
jgi:UDP-3-O-[3-hydroxymyristoyl] glucosamine N-acyltransferase